MKCHYCVDGKITLFTSVVDCEHCSGDKYSDGHVATFSAEAVKKYEDEILLPVPNTVSK